MINNELINDEEVEMLSDEELDEIEPEIESIPFKVKCKPTYNFQSIEFEWEIRNPQDQEYMFEVYKELLEGLIRLAPNQDKAENVEPATEKQLEILKKFKIPHKGNVSKEEANKLIQKSLKK